MKLVFDHKIFKIAAYSNLSKILFIFIFKCIDDNCQYWLDLKDMKLTSPNYPNWYVTDGKGCDWLLTAPEGNIITLEFNDFEVSTILIL